MGPTILTAAGLALALLGGPVRFVGFALLVAVALWAVWRDEGLSPVAWALAVSYLGSNAAHYGLAITEQPQAYTVCETAVLSMAFFAHVYNGSRLMIAVVALSMVSIGSNFWASSFDVLTKSQTYNWTATTNLIFAMECLLVTAAGVHDRARARLRDGRGLFAFHGRPAGAKEAHR